MTPWMTDLLVRLKGIKEGMWPEPAGETKTEKENSWLILHQHFFFFCKYHKWQKQLLIQMLLCFATNPTKGQGDKQFA